MEKIPVICPYLSGRGGTETVLSLISDYNDNSLTFEYVLPYKGPDSYWLKNIKHTENNKKSKFDFLNKIYAVLFIATYIMRVKSSIYIGLSTQIIFLLYVFRFVFRRKYKIVSWVHFSLHHEKTVNPNKLLRADYHLAISSGIKKQLIGIGVEEKKIYLIYNPVKHQEIKKRNVKTYTDSKHLIYIGRITYEGQKNLRELITSLSYIKGRWRLSIVGSGNEDDINKCKFLIKKFGLEENIQWHGWLRNPWDEVENVDALVMSSTYEGFGMVLVEAISRGVYCLAADCPVGPDDIVIDGVNGNLYKPGDMNGLVSIIQSFIDDNSIKDRDYISSTISRFYIENYFRTFFNAISSIKED
ncbi:glycosyltransferase [Pectobacterium atrosepticum]|uniref:glycosyltransferase n=1 Tax=Pectobacterium atrosepticum TaxID=29471 RepID=UPI0003A8EB90|nr:glycosyltransferase [Pectobacterium atrosepticum]